MALIQTTVIESIIQEQLKGKGKLVNLASDLGNLPNGVQNGETHKFIKFKHIAEPTVLVKGQPIEVEELQSKETFETVKHIGKGVEIYDYDKETVIGGKGMVDIASEQLASVFVRSLEKDLGEKLLVAPLKYKIASKTVITAQEINTAISTGFGDDQETEDMGAIVVNSMLAPSFYAMPEFVDINKTYATNGNGKVSNGVIGLFRGIPVVMSDVSTFKDGECVTFILKKGAFGYKKVKGFNTEVSRVAKYKKNEVYADMMYVVGITNDTGVIVVRNTVIVA